MWPAHAKPKFALVEIIDYAITNIWAKSFRDQPEQSDDFLTPNRTTGQDVSFEQELADDRKMRNLDALRKTVAKARELGVPVIVGVSPYRVGDGLKPLPDEATTMLKELAGAGAIVLDMPSALADESGSTKGVFLDHVHLSELGHERIGKALGASIEKALANRGT
jgi:lysophospholipase L1-like esterase